MDNQNQQGAQTPEERKLTLGEFRVGITLNPSNNPEVDAIKQMGANMISRISAIPDGTDRGAPHVQAEVAALKERAMREIESACMWAVKAATKS